MSIVPIVESGIGVDVSFMTIIRASFLLLKSREKKTLDVDEIRLAIHIFFTGEKRELALSYGNQNVLDNCLDNIDVILKNKFKSLIYYFGITKCTNRSIYYITGIYNIDNIDTQATFYNKLSIDRFIESSVNLALYLKLPRLNVKIYELLLEIVSDSGEIQIELDNVKSVHYINSIIKQYSNSVELSINYFNKL
jgi:hypothetical protein